jgi:opacity protein-like surface antigen
MLKKTAVFGSLLTVLCASSTLAHGSNFRSGFLAGAHVGYSFGTGKFNSTYGLNPGAFQPTSSLSGSSRKSAALIGILGGYRHIFSQSYTIGINLDLNLFASNESSKQLAHSFPAIPNAPITTRFKRTFSVIPNIAIGRIFCDHYHVSLGLGMAFARFKHQVVIDLANVTLPSTTQTKTGFVPSFGIEYAATKNVSIVGNLSYEIYSKLSKVYSAGFGRGATYTTSIKPRYTTLKLGAIYRF